MANDVIRRLDWEYRKKQGVSPAKRIKISANEKLEKLAQMKEDCVMFDVFIEYSNSESGDLYHYDSFEILYCIPCEEVKKLFKTYSPRANSYFLGATFKATITYIEDGVVYLSPVECSLDEKVFALYERKGNRLTSQAALLEMRLKEEILPEHKKKPVVRGTVTKVEKDRIFIDLYDTGVIGVIPVKNYLDHYVRDLREIVNVGDSLKGVVFDYRAREGESEKHYLVSTAAFIVDPFRATERFRVGDVIVVKCIEKPEGYEYGKMYFWAISRILPGLDIMADYSTKVPYTAVEEGSFYKCKIKQIDQKNRRLKVVPFDVCSAYNTEIDTI